MKGDAVKFKLALSAMFQAASKDGQPYLEVQAGPWHKVMGGYPAAEGRHSMPIVCEVMWNEFSEERGDSVLYSPLKKKGATLKIRYRLPR